MSSFRMPAVLFLKATTTKTITVPGYTRADGSYVPPHQKVVHYDPDKSPSDVLYGNGSHSQKVALKKLSKLPHWSGIPEVEKHAHILSAATNHQKKQSAAAALSGWKAAMLAGKKPSPAMQAAFDALDPAKKDALLMEVGAAPSVAVSAADGAKHDGGPAAAATDVDQAVSDGWKPSLPDILALQSLSNGEKAAKMKEWAAKLGGTDKLIAVLQEAQTAAASKPASDAKPVAPKPKAKMKQVFSVGDVVTGPLWDLPAGSVVEFDGGGGPRKALIGQSNVWFNKQKGSGWQKHPLSPSSAQSFLAGDYSNNGGAKVESIGDDGWMHPAQSAVVQQLLKIKADNGGTPKAYKLGSSVVLGEIGKPHAFVWVGEDGQWGAGFGEPDKAKLASGDGLVPLSVGDDSPNEGDTKPAADGGVLVLKDGHWVKQGDDIEALDLSTVSSWEHLKQFKSAKPGAMKVEAQAWLDANPDGASDLSSTLVDLGHLDAAKQLGIYKPPSLEPDLQSGGQAPEPADTAGAASPASDKGPNKGDAEDVSAAEMAGAAEKINDLLAGNGGHYPVKAAKKLAKDGVLWQQDTNVAALALIVETAKQMQAEASASAAVSGWKKAAHAGKNPTPAQWKAFSALPADKKSAMLSAAHDAAGGTAHLKAPAVAKDEPAPAPASQATATTATQSPALSFGEKNPGKVFAAGAYSVKYDEQAGEWQWETPSGDWDVVQNDPLISFLNDGKDIEGEPLKEVGAPAKSAFDASPAAPAKVPHAIKKLQAIDPSAVQAWLDGPSGQKSEHAMSFFEHANATPTKKFLKWVQLVGKEYNSGWKNGFTSAAVCSLYGQYDKVLTKDGQFVPTKGMSFIQASEAISDPAAIQAAAIKAAEAAAAGAPSQTASSKQSAGDLAGKSGAPWKLDASIEALGGLPAMTLDMWDGGVAFISHDPEVGFKSGVFAGSGAMIDTQTSGSIDEALAFLQVSMGVPAGDLPDASAAKAALAPGGDANTGAAKHHFMGETFTKDGEDWKTATTTYGPGGWMHAALSVLNGDEVSPAVTGKAKAQALSALFKPGSGATGVSPTKALNALFPPADGGPQEGDTKDINGVTYVLHNGRWHKQGDVPENPDTLHGATGVFAEDPSPEPDDEPEDAELFWEVFHNTTDGHNKFWAVAIDGAGNMLTHHGKIGSAGKVTVKPFGSVAAASKAADALSSKKLGGGYVSVGDQKYAPPSSAKAAPKPSSAAVKVKAAIESADGWAKTGGQQGSNPGGRFRDPSGQEWYVKTPASEAHAKNELLAAKLYEAAGVKAPELKLVTKDGKLSVASKWQDGMSKAGGTDELSMVDGALSGFAVDAWLANWDVTGLGLDNLLVGPDGKAVRIDVGGALLFRAQGGPKGDAFVGDDVPEVDTLLDAATNPLSAALFGDMSDEAKTKSAERVLAISDAAIKELVLQYGPGQPGDRSDLADKLIARKAALAKRFPKAKAPKGAVKKKLDLTKLPVNPSDLPPFHDFHNWNGPGKGLSSKLHINEANLKAEQALKDFALQGNLVALKEYHYEAIDKETGESLGMKPIAEHPSQHVKLFHSDLVQFLDAIANPPEPLRVAEGNDPTTFSSEKLGQTISTVKANQKLGFWVALGKVVDATPFVKHFVGKEKHVSSSYKAQAKAEGIGGLHKLAQRFIHRVQGSGSYNDFFRDGHASDDEGFSTAAIADACYKEAKSKPAGTTIYRWQNMTESMVKQLLEAKPGLVFQNPGSMCTSMHPTSTKGFGKHRMVIHYAEGAKAVESFASGAFKGEQEITTLMGQRFMLLKSEMSDNLGGTGKHGLEIHVLMLPPDDDYAADLQSRAATTSLKKSFRLFNDMMEAA